MFAPPVPAPAKPTAPPDGTPPDGAPPKAIENPPAPSSPDGELAALAEQPASSQDTNAMRRRVIEKYLRMVAPPEPKRLDTSLSMGRDH
jgi:hypothetical protein